MESTRAQTIGSRVRRYRIARGLTQRRLAQLADTDQSTLSSFENGHIENPTLDTLEKLARALDVTVTALIEEDAS